MSEATVAWIPRGFGELDDVPGGDGVWTRRGGAEVWLPEFVLSGPVIDADAGGGADIGQPIQDVYDQAVGYARMSEGGPDASFRLIVPVFDWRTANKTVTVIDLQGGTVVLDPALPTCSDASDPASRFGVYVNTKVSALGYAAPGVVELAHNDAKAGGPGFKPRIMFVNGYVDGSELEAAYPGKSGFAMFNGQAGQTQRVSFLTVTTPVESYKYTDRISVEDVSMASAPSGAHLVKMGGNGDGLFVKGGSGPGSGVDLDSCHGGVVICNIGGNDYLTDCEGLLLAGFHHECDSATVHDPKLVTSCSNLLIGPGRVNPPKLDDAAAASFVFANLSTARGHWGRYQFQSVQSKVNYKNANQDVPDQGRKPDILFSVPSVDDEWWFLGFDCYLDGETTFERQPIGPNFSSLDLGLQAGLDAAKSKLCVPGVLRNRYGVWTYDTFGGGLNVVWPQKKPTLSDAQFTNNSRGTLPTGTTGVPDLTKDWKYVILAEGDDGVFSQASNVQTATHDGTSTSTMITGELEERCVLWVFACTANLDVMTQATHQWKILMPRCRFRLYHAGSHLAMLDHVTPPTQPGALAGPGPGGILLPRIVGIAGPVASSDAATRGYVDTALTGAAGGDLTGNYPNPTIKNNAITTAKILDNAVDSTKLAANSVNASKITDGTVGTAELAGGAVTDGKITGPISASKLPSLDGITAPAADVSANSHKITNLADPTSAGDATPKSYVDAAIQGLKWKAPARVALATNVNLAAPGATLDGVTMAGGDRVLLTGQTTASQNGLYTWVSALTSMGRSTDADTSAEVAGMAALVDEGTYTKRWFFLPLTTLTLGTTSLSFVEMGDIADITAGAGLQRVGNVISVATGGITDAMHAADSITAASIAANAIGASELADNAVDTAAIAAGAVTDTKIAADTITAASIAANAIGSSELADSAVDTAAIQDGAVTSAKIADGTITDTDVAAANKDGAAGTASMRTLGTGAAQAAAGNDSRLSDSRAPSGTAGGALDGSYPNPGLAASVAGAGLAETSDVLSVNVDASTIEINADTLRVKAGGITGNEVAAAIKDPAAATAGLRTLGTGSAQAAAGNDSRLSDTRTPTDGTVTDAKVASAAAIAYSKLALTGSVVNADVATGAAIAESKLNLASDGLPGVATRRTLGTGSAQAMPGNKTLDAITAPTADVSINSHKLTNVTDPGSPQDVATKNYVDAGTKTVTNTRITKRIETLADAATVTPNSDSYDGGSIAELSQATTIANPSGTPTAFQVYLLRVKSTTSRALTWGAQYRGSTDVALPTATTATKWFYAMFIWNTVDSKWDLSGLVTGF